MLIDSNDAQRIISRNVCSDCWEHLEEYPVFETVDGKKKRIGSEVRCSTPGCECHGFVSKSFVERRMSEQHGEAAEAQHALRPVLEEAGFVKKETEAELLSHLGF